MCVYTETNMFMMFSYTNKPPQFFDRVKGNLNMGIPLWLLNFATQETAAQT